MYVQCHAKSDGDHNYGYSVYSLFILSLYVPVLQKLQSPDQVPTIKVLYDSSYLAAVMHVGSRQPDYLPTWVTTRVAKPAYKLKIIPNQYSNIIVSCQGPKACCNKLNGSNKIAFMHDNLVPRPIYFFGVK